MILTYLGNSNDLKNWSIQELREVLSMPYLNGVSRNQLAQELNKRIRKDKTV